MARKTKEEAQITRALLLDTAERVFYAQGVSRTSLADVAAAAGVTRGAIYGHFENKVDLFNAMCDRVHLPLETLCEASDPLKEPDPLGRLREIMVYVLQNVAHDPHTRRVFDIILFKCELTDNMGQITKRRQEGYNKANQHMVKALTNAVTQKQLPAQLDIHRTARSLHAFITGLLYNWLIDPEQYDLAREAPFLIDSYFDLLKNSALMRHQDTGGR